MTTRNKFASCLPITLGVFIIVSAIVVSLSDSFTYHLPYKSSSRSWYIVLFDHSTENQFKRTYSYICQFIDSSSSSSRRHISHFFLFHQIADLAMLRILILDDTAAYNQTDHDVSYNGNTHNNELTPSVGNTKDGKTLKNY